MSVHTWLLETETRSQYTSWLISLLMYDVLRKCASCCVEALHMRPVLLLSTVGSKMPVRATIGAYAQHALSNAAACSVHLGRQSHAAGCCGRFSPRACTFLVCSEYADFRVSSDGELQGVGLLIANEPVNKHLLVLSAIKGSPADRAGITTGARCRIAIAVRQVDYGASALARLHPWTSLRHGSSALACVAAV